jgi:hypothetical protein
MLTVIPLLELCRNSASASGALPCLPVPATSAIGSVINNNNNNFSNITVSGTATIAGWVNTDAGNGSKTIQGNTFSNWNAETGVITAMNINSRKITILQIMLLIQSLVQDYHGITTAAGNDNIFRIQLTD